MELLQVDIDEMKEHLQTLESEIEEFRPFVESGFADEIQWFRRCVRILHQPWKMF